MTRILIINPSALVEIVHGLQVATSIKAQWGDKKEPLQIDWIVRDIFAPLVKASQAVDQVYVFKRFGSTLDFIKLMAEVRKTNYDYVFDFQGLLRTGLMTWRAKGKKKVGRENAREGATVFYNTTVPLPAAGRKSHKLDILLQFLPVIDLKPVLEGKLAFREVDNLKLSFLEGRKGMKTLLMFPDARRPEKNWQGFRELTKLILDKHKDFRVVWAGDNAMGSKTVFPEDRFLNLTGKTSLLSLPSLIKKADIVMANDSGPLHLAAALGVRNIGIYGPSDYQTFGAYPVGAATNHIVQAPVANLKLLQEKDVYKRFSSLVQAGS